MPGIRQAGAKMKKKISFVICSIEKFTKGVGASEKFMAKTLAKKAFPFLSKRNESKICFYSMPIEEFHIIYL